MRRLITVVAIAIWGFGATQLTGCSANPAVAAGQLGSGSPVTINEQDAGKSVEVAKGQLVLIRLASNPTTGYQWMLAGNPAPLEFQRSEFAADPQGKNAIGAGGTQTISLIAKSAGTAALRLEYRRPWEKNVAPAKTLSVTVAVK